MSNNIIVPEYAKVKVYWDDRPENYSRQNKIKVRDYFSKKYGISKSNINVIYRPIKIGKDGEVIEISGAGVDNILDRNYQVELMKEWCKREEKDVNFKRILDLDKKVNDSLNEEEISNENHRSWALRWLYIDNFLSFGDKNFTSFSNLNGLNVVNSEPPNQGGKTVFTVDAIKFLLFGKTTKTDKNEQIFNTFTDKDELTVRGMIEIEGEEMIIERKLSRRKKRNGIDYNITNKVNYYKLLPDGEEEILNDEDSKKTDEVIKKNIGSENDFDITILTTARNLEDLIDAKPTESGRLLTRFIGLEVIEAKEKIAKEMNSEFNKMKKGNHYNIPDLISDNETLEEDIKIFKDELVGYKESLKVCEETIQRLDNEKDRLINSKLKVDVEVSDLNPEKLSSDIDAITQRGLSYKNKIKEFELEIAKIKDVTYDEYEYDDLVKKDKELSIKIGSYKSDILSFGKVIDNLKESEICETCKRPLEDVDNTETIEEYETKIENLKKGVSKKEEELEKILTSINKIKENRDIVDRRDRLELERDKSEVEIGSLRNKIMSKKEDLKKYKNNEDAIKTNISIESDISSVKTDLIVQNNSKSSIGQKIFSAEQGIDSAKEKITKNLKMIKTLKGEEEIDKIFKVYLQLVGKKGISKLVLRSVLPIINSEIQRLLDDVCDFEVELVMTNKNEIEYHIIKNEVTKLLKSGSGLERTISSLALRCVLSKISHLPKPNFITFDEVLGKLAADNIERVRPMFEKIKGMFDIVFFITHNDLVKDWSDKVITIKKVDNISSIKV